MDADARWSDGARSRLNLCVLHQPYLAALSVPRRARWLGHRIRLHSHDCDSFARGQWFDKKRSSASGIVSAGFGIGGLIFSFARHAMIDNISLASSLRITRIYYRWHDERDHRVDDPQPQRGYQVAAACVRC